MILPTWWLLVDDAHEVRAGEHFKPGLPIWLKVGLVVSAFAVGKMAYDHFSQTAEQRSIKRSVRHHTMKGRRVVADHIGCERVPPLLGRRRPDVVAEDNGIVYVEEHETRASVNRRHSIEQDRDLRRWAARYSNVRYRQVVVD
jgi:hypothetical protein